MQLGWAKQPYKFWENIEDFCTLYHKVAFLKLTISCSTDLKRADLGSKNNFRVDPWVLREKATLGRGSRGNCAEEMGVPRDGAWIAIGVRGRTEVLACKTSRLTPH